MIPSKRNTKVPEKFDPHPEGSAKLGSEKVQTHRLKRKERDRKRKERDVDPQDIPEAAKKAKVDEDNPSKEK